MARSLRALVVDDSAFNRKVISEILGSIEGVEVVGKAADGEQALRLASTLEVDLITLDLEMPRMDGFTFLRLLMAKSPTAVVVVSSHSEKKDVFRALELGALDFVVKPSASPGEELRNIGDALREKVELVRRVRPSARLKPVVSGTPATGVYRPSLTGAKAKPASTHPTRLIVIASSTGGPSALLRLFARLQTDSEAAVIIAQHMPPRFTRTFAERLDRLGGMRVTEASGGDRLRAGHALVCPGGRCTEVVGGDDEPWTVRISLPAATDRYVPSADRLFASAARVAMSRCSAFVLTGMGDDGAAGALKVRDEGGTVYVQDPQEAVLDGMPRSAVHAGAADFIHPLETLRDKFVRLLGGKRRPGG